MNTTYIYIYIKQNAAETKKHEPLRWFALNTLNTEDITCAIKTLSK